MGADLAALSREKAVHRFAETIAAAIACVALSWSAAAAAQSAGAPAQAADTSARTVTTLDARCVAQAVADCVARASAPAPLQNGQTLPTVDYRASKPCEQHLTYDENGNLTTACNYDAPLHGNTAMLDTCQARIRSNPPAECQNEVLTARGTQEMMQEALRQQTAALRDALFAQCLATAQRYEDCDALRPQVQ
jgi:hypothetical protein